MVYDQGFEVTVAGRSFFHFMHYTQNGTTVTTDCGRSLEKFGWYHEVAAPGQAPAHFGCYRATKAKAQRVAPRALELATHASGPLGGVPRSAAWLADAPRAVQDSRSDAVKYFGLPTAFDWSDKTAAAPHGRVEPMRDQLTCGSCYAFAGTSMLAARARVRSDRLNAENLMLSPQDVVSCAGYSQVSTLYNDGSQIVSATRIADNFTRALLENRNHFSAQPMWQALVLLLLPSDLPTERNTNDG
jgi:C1A family cysteine protease